MKPILVLFDIIVVISIIVGIIGVIRGNDDMAYNMLHIAMASILFKFWLYGIRMVREGGKNG